MSSFETWVGSLDIGVAGSAEDDPWIAWLGGLSDDLAPLVLVWEYRIGRSGRDRFVVDYEGRKGG